MSAPRTKRQFAGAASDPAQRQITSFFSSSGASHIAQNAARAHNPVSPALPASVQANLISVGMRVRKSVPEGYKTGSYSAFALWGESGASATHTSTDAIMGEGRSRANAISTPRELLPFCGIHKVGGLDTQPENDSSTYQPLNISVTDSMDDDIDDVPGLTSSQETVESPGAGVTPTKARKRSYTEDEDDRPEIPGRLNLNMNFNVWRDNFDDEVSPRSLAPTSWSPTIGGGNGRIMAVPRKTKLRGGSKLAAISPRVLDQENMMVEDVDGGASGDFGEADFLVGTGGRNWEVEMSDA